MDASADVPEDDPVPRLKGALGVVLGVAGEALLTLGILVGLFLVWEVWWTDVIGTRQQQDIVDAIDWRVPVTPACELSHACPPSSDEVKNEPEYPILSEESKERDLAPPVEAAPDSTETFATLYVPRWGTEYIRPISEGIGRRSVLDKLGIGHYPTTELPGGWGNFAIAGHRTTFGKPFERIEELKVGDVLVVRTESTWYVYRVTETHIVRPSFDAAIAPVPGDKSAIPDGRYITLTTCHPKYSASLRYVVYGVLDYWADAEKGYPAEIVKNGTGTSIAMAITGGMS